MTRIVLIDGHPDADSKHFVHALADAYARGAERHHECRRLDLAKLEFPVLRSPTEWTKGKPVRDIADAQAAIDWSEHLVIVFPLWMGTMPALLKAFVEQVARPGFAIDEGGRFPRGLLKGRSAHIVVTMGMPALAYRWFYRAHGVKALERNILRFAGFAPVTTTIIGAVDSSEDRRRAWLASMEKAGMDGR